MIRELSLIIVFFCIGAMMAIGQEAADTIPQTINTEESTTGQVSEVPSDAVPGVISGPQEAAAQAYRDRDFSESIALYEEIIAQGKTDDKVSAQLYYNLGNAYFRGNQLGKAILNYERALLLDPGDSDIRHNLRFVQNRTIDRINIADTLFLTNWFRGIRNIFSVNQWGTISIVLFILFLACVAVYLFVRQLWARKTAFYTGIVLFLLVISANIFAFSQKRERVRGDSAIVMVGAAAVNASPDVNGNQLFELHEGTKVKIRNTDGNWFEIQIADGSVGWIQQKNVEKI